MRWTVLAALLMTACASSSSSDRVASTAPTSAAMTVTSPAASVDAITDEEASPATNVTVPSSGIGLDRVRPEGLDSTLARTTLSDGSVCEFCVWLADTAPQRARGLMFVTDLGEADAMAFRYPKPRTGTFWMKNTLLPLSIAFFAPDGEFLSSFDMEPCEADPCPSYRTARNFQMAVEVPQGDLAEFGLVEGSTFELLDLPCNP